MQYMREDKWQVQINEKNHGWTVFTMSPSRQYYSIPDFANVGPYFDAQAVWLYQLLKQCPTEVIETISNSMGIMIEQNDIQQKG